MKMSAQDMWHMTQIPIGLSPLLDWLFTYSFEYGLELRTSGTSRIHNYVHGIAKR